MNKRRMSYLRAAVFLALLLLFLPWPAVAQSPDGAFTHIIVEGALTPKEQEQLSSLVYQALGTMEPNLASYVIEAETRVLRNQNGVLVCDTVAQLRSLVIKQAYLFRLVGEYSLPAGTWTVLESNPSYVPEAVAPAMRMSADEVAAIWTSKLQADKSLDAGGIENRGEAYNNAKAVMFAPISGEDSWAGWAADRITGKFRAGGWLSDIYKSPNATEPTAWNYLMYGSALLTWYSNSHGITQSYNGAPCDGLVYNGGNLMHNEFSNMSSWIGLIYNVSYVDACNSYMNPLRSSIWNNHSLRTYIGGLRLMPFQTSDKADERFWKYVLTDGWTMSSALSQAMSDFGLTGYYAITGYTGTYGPRPLRAELTWGAQPRDLDHHLWLPSGNPYHVYWAQRGSTTTHPYAWLDRDDTDGYGPEKMLVVEAYPGSYRFAVYNSSNERSLAGSGATVRIYRGSTLIQTIVVPSSGSGRWWVVFEYNGTDGTITVRNYLTTSYPGPYGASGEMSGK